jgi:alpha-galactosidase
MGVNTWYAVGTQVNENVVVGMANAMVSNGLVAAGYTILWIDGGWWNGARDARGTIVAPAAQWPHGMSWLTAYLHALGIHAGIYTDVGHNGCTGPGIGSYGHYQQDANTFAAWGFDAVKADFCGGRRLSLNPGVAYSSFASALAADSPHRPILLNICNGYAAERFGPENPPYNGSAYAAYRYAGAIAGSWRTSGDIGIPQNVAFSGVLANLDQDSLHPYVARPGHWNDPDYLVPDAGMTLAEAQAQFTMWSIVAAPLVLGDDARTMPPQTRAMVTNPEAIAIDQDRLGTQGWLAARAGQVDVWVRPLAGGARAVAFLNRGTVPASISVDASTLGLESARSYQVRDVWAHTTTRNGARFRKTLPGDSAMLMRVIAVRPASKHR